MLNTSRGQGQRSIPPQAARPMPKLPQECVGQVGFAAEAASGRDRDHPLFGIEHAGERLTQPEAFQVTMHRQAGMPLEDAAEVERRHAHPRRQLL